jgi:single-strand DNA-binding protein
MNVVVLQGLLASPLVARDLPAGGVAVSFDVSTRTADGVVSVPASWIAPSTVPSWEVGQEVTVVGVVRRRFFRSGGSTQSRTEVLVSEAVPTSRRASVRKLVQRAVTELAESV